MLLLLEESEIYDESETAQTERTNDFRDDTSLSNWDFGGRGGCVFQLRASKGLNYFF